MRFFQIIASGAALIASALAQSTVIAINSYPQNGVVAGQQYTITYSPADNTPTTFILRKGPSGNLGTIGTLTTTATGGSFTWNVASSLVNGADYALEIRRGSEVNYSAQFGLTGGSGTASSSAVSSASASASSAASSSSSAASSSASSISSRVSSASSALITSQSSLTTSASSAVSASISSSASRNGTVSTSRPSGTSSASIPESTGAAASLASSPLALIFGAVAAMAFLN